MSAVLQHGYRGRVRTGCFTCRSRKVKCDEAKPACDNCTRLERRCVYKPKKSQQRTTKSTDTASRQSPRSVEDISINHVSLQPNSSTEADDTATGPESSAVTHTYGDSSKAWDGSHNPFLHPDSWRAEVTARLERALQGQTQSPSTLTLSPDNGQGQGHSDTDLPATLISRDIELTTTMDFLASREEPSQLVTFFTDEVECPGITPFDAINWQRAKLHLVELGKGCPVVASGVIAVSALYKTQLYGLPQSRALSHYRAVKRSFDELLKDHGQEFNTVIVVAFLLCLFELIHAGEIVPVFKEPSKLFVEKLATWASAQLSSSSPPPSPLTMRLITWLKIIQSITMRGGGTGLLSSSIEILFPAYESPIPTISAPTDHNDPDGASSGQHLCEVLGAPLFDFYFRLQLVSRDIAQLTHYHRSRTTGIDQDEVVERVAQIKSRLRALWASRSTTQRQTPQDLLVQLAPRIARTLASLIGICDAAYHTEFVEIDRVLGDPVSRWTDSRDALRRIRDIVDEDWELQQGKGSDTCATATPSEPRAKLNPGYLRALFLYAIECMDEEQTRWATDRIAAISSPVYRSDFFAKFAAALSDAQLRKERRVTSKYFCIWFFGVPPPYM